MTDQKIGFLMPHAYAWRFKEVDNGNGELAETIMFGFDDDEIRIKVHDCDGDFSSWFLYRPGVKEPFLEGGCSYKTDDPEEIYHFERAQKHALLAASNVLRHESGTAFSCEDEDHEFNTEGVCKICYTRA